MKTTQLVFCVIVFILGGFGCGSIHSSAGSSRSTVEGYEMADSMAMTKTQAGKAASGLEKTVQESPFACNMLALDAEARLRHITVMKEMRAATKEVQELPDGYAFRFPADQSTILLVSEFIARERLCCPFFAFELVAEREGGPLWLRLRGRQGIKDFIKIEMRIKPTTP